MTSACACVESQTGKKRRERKHKKMARISSPYAASGALLLKEEAGKKKGAKDMARESVHLWDKHVAPIVVNPELVADDEKNKKNKNKKNKKDNRKH